MTARTQIARRAADALERADLSGLALGPAVIGFDGFVDAIADAVDRRGSMRADDYERLETISAFAQRCASAAGKSTNIEIVVREQRFGGNGPLMAGATAALGLPTAYLGAVGQEADPRALHPLYAELERRCKASGPGGRVEPLAPPAHTLALEFDDGKLMLGQPRNVQQVTWPRLVETFGLDVLRGMVTSAPLVAVVNWTMMAGVQGILEALGREILAPAAAAMRGTAAPGHPQRLRWPRVFLDLCDPAKRTDADVAAVLNAIAILARSGPVTLGLNLAEAQRVDAVAGTRALSAAAGAREPDGPAIAHAAARIRDALNADCVVIHPRAGAGAALATGEPAWFDGPLVRHPKLSTGAGDHFNAGFALAQVAGLPLEECLAAGCATSGVYVRDAASPTLARLVEFLRDLPAPESA